MKTVLVLTAIERAFYSATIEYQLIEPVLRVKTRRKNVRFLFLCLVPFTFYFTRGDIRHTFRVFSKARKRLKSVFNNSKSRIVFIPVLFPFRHKGFYLKFLLIPLFLLSNFPILFFVILLYGPSIIHARGYPAGLLACISKLITGVGFIFDMRDVYTKKGIEAGFFTQNCVSAKFWNATEGQMLSSADAVIVTSTPFKDYVVNILSSDKRVWLVPNSVNTHRFFPDEKSRIRVRRNLNIDDKFVLIHSGTFSTRQDVGFAARYFKKWKNLKENSFFLLLTANKKNIGKISAVFEKEKVSPDNFAIINPEPEEVPDLLKAGDIALHLESQSLATEYCIAIKDGEYLATGLPVVCTPFLKGIAPLIEKYNVGIVTDPDRELSAQKEIYLLNNLVEIKKNTQRIVKDVLSLDKGVQVLDECYEVLLKSRSLSFLISISTASE